MIASGRSERICRTMRRRSSFSPHARNVSSADFEKPKSRKPRKCGFEPCTSEAAIVSRARIPPSSSYVRDRRRSVRLRRSREQRDGVDSVIFDAGPSALPSSVVRMSGNTHHRPRTGEIEQRLVNTAFSDCSAVLVSIGGAVYRLRTGC